jgi:hypothetical protein
MLALIGLYTCFYLFQCASSSTLTVPPLSALIVAFENVYDLSLLANTLSDEGFDTTLIIPSYAASDVYNKLIDVEVLQLNININKSMNANKHALTACESLYRDVNTMKKIWELKATFTIFPALRYINLKFNLTIILSCI